MALKSNANQNATVKRNLNGWLVAQKPLAQMPSRAEFLQSGPIIPANKMPTTNARCACKPVKEFFMPITQASMIEQMHEARAAHRAFISLRNSIIKYAESARARYAGNADLEEVLYTLIVSAKGAPVPDDRATYFNERHYASRAKWNDKARDTQEQLRRKMGMPTRAEADKARSGKAAAFRKEKETNPYYNEYVRPADWQPKPQEELLSEPKMTGQLPPGPSAKEEPETYMGYAERPKGPNAKFNIPTDIDEYEVPLQGGSLFESEPK